MINKLPKYIQEEIFEYYEDRFESEMQSKDPEYWEYIMANSYRRNNK